MEKIGGTIDSVEILLLLDIDIVCITGFGGHGNAGRFRCGSRLSSTVKYQRRFNTDSNKFGIVCLSQGNSW